MDILNRFDLSSISEKSISEYTATELAAYLVQRFPSDPVTHLQIERCNGDIGGVLYNEVYQLLKGAGYDKRKEACEKISIERSAGRPGYTNRPTRKGLLHTV